MPVSPQDFELYSRMTGAPMPSDAMSRMKMAPDVYKFTKNFARKPNLLEKTGNLIKSAGRNTLVGAGLLAGMDLDNQERQRQELMRNEADKAEAESVTMENPVEEVADSPAMAKIRLQMKADEIKHQNKLELQDRMDARAGFSREGQQPTTADAFGQDLIENQTADNVVDKKMEQGSQIADSTPNIAEVLSESQDSIPASIFRPTQIPTMGALQAATPVVASGLSETGNEVNVIKGVEEEMVGSGATSGKVENFLKKMGGTDEGSKLDVALLAAMQDRDKKERFYLGANSGDPDLGNSPLIDHPDLPGGEDDINLPSGTNTGSTTNLEDHYREMRRLDAQERTKDLTPSEKQVRMNNPAFDDPSHHSNAANRMDPSLFNKVPAGYEVNYGHPVFKDQDSLPTSDAYELDDIITPTTTQKVDAFTNKIMPNKPSSFVESMSLDSSADKAPTATFNLNKKEGGTSPYTVQLSSPMAVSLGMMAEDDSLKEESFGKLFNLAKKSIKDGSGMAFGMDQ